MASTIAGSLNGTTEVEVVPAQIGGGNLPEDHQPVDDQNADSGAIYLTVVHAIGNTDHLLADAEHIPSGGTWEYQWSLRFTGPSQSVAAFLSAAPITTNPTFAYTLS